MLRQVALGIFVLFPTLSLGVETTKPPKPLTSLQIGARITSKIMENSHIRVKGKGFCLWLTKKVPPKIIPAAAISQFVPDLIVTVSNNPQENPWIEARSLIENKAAVAGYKQMYQSRIGFPLGFGKDSQLSNPSHFNEGHTRVVSVFGAPPITLPKLTHQPETRFPAVYYSSLADAVMERTEVAELAYMATHPNLLLGHEIGTLTNHWGFEMPRLMYVSQPSRFRASVVAAMHAADIVTNERSLHLSATTTNRCGRDCIVANVIYDPKQKQVIWQEVYPKNRIIKPGDLQDFGIKDEESGNGNYIFVVWRQYEGCVEQDGKLISGVGMGQPHRR